MNGCTNTNWKKKTLSQLSLVMVFHDDNGNLIKPTKPSIFYLEWIATRALDSNQAD